MSHLRHLPFPPGPQILHPELWLLRLIAEKEVVVGLDPTHGSASLDRLVVEKNAIVGEAETSTARHCRGVVVGCCEREGSGVVVTEGD